MFDDDNDDDDNDDDDNDLFNNLVIMIHSFS